MFYSTPVRRMINYGQTEMATFNPQDPIGFKAFYDSALKGIGYARTFYLMKSIASSAPVKPIGQNRDYYFAVKDLDKKISGLEREKKPPAYYLMALAAQIYLDAISKMPLPSQWQSSVQDWFKNENTTTFLTYANPNAVVNSPFGQGNPETALENLSIYSEELGLKLNDVKAIGLLIQYLKEEKLKQAQAVKQIQRVVSPKPTIKAATLTVTKPKTNWPLIAAIFGALYFIAQRK